MVTVPVESVPILPKALVVIILFQILMIYHLLSVSQGSIRVIAHAAISKGWLMWVRIGPEPHFPAEVIVIHCVISCPLTETKTNEFYHIWADFGKNTFTCTMRRTLKNVYGSYGVIAPLAFGKHFLLFEQPNDSWLLKSSASAAADDDRGRAQLESNQILTWIMKMHVEGRADCRSVNGKKHFGDISRLVK